ncbi:EH signature domain-containing protein, partial [Prochlorothrix hollandica]|uniref:EH signature domain-containing protein n=1 Tax=Prochlorothrix hollandica TaxID=1223 RepID=UPI0033426A77
EIESPINKERNRKERNQIDKRRYFWSNYSDRFEAIRILVPPSSYQVLEHANHNMNHIEKLVVLSVSAAEEMEICLFDFGDYIIAEMFRGLGSKSYLIQKENAPDLMLRQNLSLTTLKALSALSHGHPYLWQNSCERWLARHKIFPNDGITEFRQDSKKYHPYSRSQGMPRPSSVPPGSVGQMDHYQLPSRRYRRPS